MTVTLQPLSGRPVEGVSAPPAEVATGPGFLRRALLAAAVVFLLFTATYALAWFNAYRLSARFASEAEELYTQGKYLDALVGYEEFNPQTNRYTTRGGFVRVERIWSHSNSWPLPPLLQKARQRSSEIINQRLTIADAEEYIRNNTGKPALYFAEIYLRLGELYEADGDTRSASEIYQTVIDLFPTRTDLTAIAQEHLDQLETNPN